MIQALRASRVRWALSACAPAGAGFLYGIILLWSAYPRDDAPFFPLYTIFMLCAALLLLTVSLLTLPAGYRFPKRNIGLIVALVLYALWGVACTGDQFAQANALMVLIAMTVLLVPIDERVMRALFYCAVGVTAANMVVAYRVSQGGVLENNSLAALCAMAAFMTLYCVRLGAVRFWNPLCIFALAGSLLTVYLNDSRGTYLLLLAAVLMYWLWPHIARGRKLFWISSAVFMLLYIALFLGFDVIYTQAPKSMEHFVYTVFHKSIFSGRDAIWEDALSVLKGHFLTGVSAPSLGGLIHEDPVHLHNIILQNVFYFGLIGLVLLLLFFFLLWRGYRAQWRDALTRLSAAFFFGLVVNQMVEVYFQLRPTFTPWIFFFLLLPFARVRRPDDPAGNAGAADIAPLREEHIAAEESGT